MSQKELLDEVKKLRKRLKDKDAHIGFLKEKLNDQQRKTDKIRELALKIGELCDPTIGNSAQQEWDYVLNRVTDGTSIFVSSDVLERASSSYKLSDDETLQQETAGDQTRGGNLETSHGRDMDSHSRFYLTSGRIDQKKRGNQRNKYEVIDNRGIQKPRHSRVIKHNRLVNQPYSAPVQSMEQVKRKMMIDQAKAVSAPGTRYKSRKTKTKPKPPEFKPARKTNDFLLPDESEVRASSAELILVPSIERFPNNFGEQMPLLSNYNSEAYSGSKNGPPLDRMLSDRSLSSIAKVLPSVPSQQDGSFGNMGALINLGNLGTEYSNDSGFINLADEGFTVSPRL